MNNFKIIGCATLAIGGCVVILLLSPFAVVNAGYRGVVVQLGQVKEEILQEGFHWVHPLATVYELNVQTQKFETQANAASKDLQTISSTIAVNYHLRPESVNKLYQEIGLDYETRIITPAIQEVVKAATAHFTAEELITKRAEVSGQIQQGLVDKLAIKYILIEAVSITNFDFSQEFNRAIESKVTAEQNALASKNKLEQVKYEAEQRIVQAEAEAEAIRIQAQSISSQGGEAYVNLKAVDKWDGILPTYMLNDTMPFLNIQ